MTKLFVTLCFGIVLMGGTNHAHAGGVKRWAWQGCGEGEGRDKRSGGRTRQRNRHIKGGKTEN